MTISDYIHVNLDTEKIDPAVFDVLTYKNPDYYQKMNLGLSVWGTPKTVPTYWLEGRELRVMRGEALKVKTYFEAWKPEFSHPDHPIKIQYINNDFPLDEYQEQAVKNVVHYRQGIVHAVTSAGKSLIILKSIAEIGQRALIVVHRKILMKQILEDIDKYIRDEHGNKITPGIIGDGKLSLGPITIAIDKTLAKHLNDYREDFGTVILDECHLVPADTVCSLLNGINSKHRYGFTGTLRRKDEKQFLIYSTFGQVIATISKEQLLGEGRVVPVVTHIWESETKFDWDSVAEALGTTKARHEQNMFIAGDPSRNDMILKNIAKMKGKTMILSNYVKPCQELAARYTERYGEKTGIITGRDAKLGQASYEEMKHGDLRIIFATVGCVSTGVSISDLDNIVLISPIYNNELLLHQIRGRLMRTSEGKEEGHLYFVYDPYIFGENKLNRFLSIIRK